MSNAPRKCRRLYLRSGIPHAKLVRLMSELREEDDLEDAIDITRHSLRKAWEDVYKEVGRTVDLVVNEKKHPWPIVSFKSGLQYLVKVSPAFKLLLKQLW